MAKDVVKQDSQSPVAPVFRVGEGFEDFDEQDRSYPRIAIAQSNSAVVSDGKVKVGNFYNTLDETDLGNSITVAVVRAFKQRLRLVPGEGLVCRSLDTKTGSAGQECATCPYQQWDGEKAPSCSLVYNYLVILKPDFEAGLPLPVVMPFMRTAAKVARKFNQMLNYISLRGQGIYARWFILTATKESNSKGTFFVPSVAMSDPTPKELQQLAHGLRQSFSGNIDVEAKEEELF